MLLVSFIARCVVYSSIVHHVSGILFFKGFPDSGKTWTQAEAKCHCTGRLATWSSQSEYDRIKRARDNVHGLSADVWVGLAQEVAFQWEFIDGDAVYCAQNGGCASLPQWGSGEPSSDATELYAELLEGGFLDNVVASDQNGYVCEFDCNGNNFFAAFSDIVSWHTAKSKCATFDTKLATFHSASEYSLIDQARQFAGVNAVWIGLTDKDAEGKWKFIDNNMGYCGGDCDTLVQWSVGEPNDYCNGANGEDYAVLSSGGLNDVPNDYATPGYVCRFEGGDGYYGLSEY